MLDFDLDLDSEYHSLTMDVMLPFPGPWQRSAEADRVDRLEGKPTP
jgi:hypothetical protein